MAAVAVPSRFAGLKIEDEEFTSSGDGQKVKKPKANTAKKIEPQKKAKSTTNNNKTQSAAKKKKSKPPGPTAEQWEQWKQKDEELVDGNFETELQQAILLSKLDYEEKKDVYKQSKKEAEVEKKLSEQVKTTKKQKKKNVMSLEQFNDMVSGDDSKNTQEDEKHTNDSPKAKKPDKDTEFFERVKDETKTELLKDKIIDRVRHRQNVSDEVITRVQFADALEKKDLEIAALRQEIVDLKEELLTVKSRNKKLCNILGQGEMRDKATVLVEAERLRGEVAELSAALATAHGALERERSRPSDMRGKDKKKKDSVDK